jgi:hypothetical protein
MDSHFMPLPAFMALFIAAINDNGSGFLLNQVWVLDDEGQSAADGDDEDPPAEDVIHFNQQWVYYNSNVGLVFSETPKAAPEMNVDLPLGHTLSVLTKAAAYPALDVTLAGAYGLWYLLWDVEWRRLTLPEINNAKLLKGVG